jgi:GIY-YIG catalytic domain
MCNAGPSGLPQLPACNAWTPADSRLQVIASSLFGSHSGAKLSAAIFETITTPERLWTPLEILGRPCPVPEEPGVYGWYFRSLPCEMDVSACRRVDGLTLLYVGSASNLRRRLCDHCRDRGGSTLRRTLAALLRDQLELKPGSGTRGNLRIGVDGERRLSEWLAANATVIWAVTPEPETVERQFIEQLELPLNLMHNPRTPLSANASGR